MHGSPVSTSESASRKYRSARQPSNCKVAAVATVVVEGGTVKLRTERNRVMRPLTLEVGLILDGQFLVKRRKPLPIPRVEASAKALANTLSTAKRRSRNSR